MNVRFGYRDVVYPGDNLGTLRRKPGSLDDMDDLHARKAEDGYLLLRRLVNRAKVQRVHPKYW